MFLFLIFMLSMAHTNHCYASYYTSSLISEKETKENTPLRSGHGVPSFTTHSKHHAVVQKQLVGVFRKHNILIPDLMPLVLGYCGKTWKKYASIPTIRQNKCKSIIPKAALIQYQGTPCLVAPDSVPGFLNIWDLENNQLCAKIRAGNNEIHTLHVTADGKRLFLCAHNDAIKAYDTRTLTQGILQCIVPYYSGVAISSDGTFIARMRNFDAALQVLETTSNERPLQPREFRSRQLSVDICLQDFSPDSRLIVGQKTSRTQNNRIFVWSLPHGHMVNWWEHNRPMSVQFKDNNTIVYNYDKQLRQRTLVITEEGLTVSDPAILMEEDENIEAFSYALDRSLLAIHTDLHLIIKDTEKNTVISRILHFTAAPLHMCFSHDNQYCAETSADPGVADVFQSLYDVDNTEEFVRYR